MARRRYRKKRNWVVVMLVSAVAAFCILSSMQDKFGMEIGMPRINLPAADFIYDLVDELTDAAGSQPSVGHMDNAMEVSAPVAGEGVTVHMLNMGQADSYLIQGPEATVLIDAGENGQGDRVLRYLSEQGVKELDIAIGTHPHSDHVGGLDTVIDGIPVKRVILPEIPAAITPTTRTWSDVLDAIDRAGLTITLAQPGATYDLGDGATLTILGPLAEYGDLNNISVVSRLDYGATSFLFCGDIEQQAELGLADRAHISADVLQAPHHGSGTSSTQEFLDRVDPQLVLISCGMDNSYGHPHREVIERLQARDVAIYRTDLNGAVTVHSNGEEITVSSER